MSQLFSLLQLPSDAQKLLASLRSPETIKLYSMRRLITLARLPASQQVEELAKLKTGSPQGSD